MSHSSRTDLVGIDVGGTKCLGVLVDEQGRVLAECRKPTPHARDLVEVLASIVDELGARPHLTTTTVGVGVPGLITFDGVVRASPNLRGARDIPVAAGLSELLGVTVHVENDATSAAHGEWRAGAAIGADDAVMVTLGTGIGGGIVMGGRLQRGAHGFAGEMGHMIVARDGIACPCGLRGCWERYASGSALADAATGRTGEQVVEAARDGEAHALARIEEFAEWVALGLASLVNLCDPEVVVLGGGVIGSHDVVMPAVRRHFAASLYSPEARPHPRLEAAVLGERAGAIGAALLAAEVV